MDNISIISKAVKEWTDERDFFAAAVRCATSPEQLEAIIRDKQWEQRRKAAGDKLKKTLEVTTNG